MKKLYPVFALVGFCWLVYGVNNLICHNYFSQYGIIPRTKSGLPGIFCAPFLHASFPHLLANTIPLLVLGSIIAWRSTAAFVWITIGGTLLGGTLTWLAARNACHIGASGLIFCYFGYILAFAWFQRTVLNILLAVVCIFLYGGALWGLSPLQTGVSWEGHAAGLFAGVTLAAVGNVRKAQK